MQSECKLEMDVLYQIPDEVHKAATLIWNYMETNGHREWQFRHVASRDLVNKLEAQLKQKDEEIAERSRSFIDLQMEHLGSGSRIKMLQDIRKELQSQLDREREKVKVLEELIGKYKTFAKDLHTYEEIKEEALGLVLDAEEQLAAIGSADKEGM